MRAMYKLYLFSILTTFAIYLILEFVLFASYGSVTIYTPNGGAIGSANETALLIFLFELLILAPLSKHEFRYLKASYLTNNNIKIEYEDVENTDYTYIKNGKEYVDTSLSWYDKIISYSSKLTYILQVIIIILIIKGSSLLFR